MSMEWIHCNKCYMRYTERTKFYVTNCTHVLCSKCANKIEIDNNCVVCHSACQTMLLSNNLNVEVQQYFQPQAKAIEHLKQVCTFQFTNSMNLMKCMSAKYDSAKKELMKCYAIIKNMKNTNSSLLAHIKRSGIGKPLGNAPASDVGISPAISNFFLNTPIDSRDARRLPTRPGYAQRIEQYRNDYQNNTTMSSLQHSQGSTPMVSIPTRGYPGLRDRIVPVHDTSSEAVSNTAKYSLAQLHLGANNRRPTGI